MRKVERGKWKEESGKRKVERGRWKEESGRWKVERGRWKVEREMKWAATEVAAHNFC